MKVPVIVYFLILLPFFSDAQKVLHVQGIIGNYTMGDLKRLQMELRQDYHTSGIAVERTMDFPLSLQGEIGLDLKKRKLTYGGYLTYAITKGKLGYSDYSGVTFVEQRVSRIGIGLKVSRKIIKQLSLYGKVGLNKSMLDLKFKTTIHGSGSSQEDYNFQSTGFSLEPGISWDYTFKRLLFNIGAGYELNKQGQSQRIGSQAYLTDNNGKSVYINWNGFRAGIGIGIIFN